MVSVKPLHCSRWTIIRTLLERVARSISLSRDQAGGKKSQRSGGKGFVEHDVLLCI